MGFLNRVHPTTTVVHRYRSDRYGWQVRIYIVPANLLKKLVDNDRRPILMPKAEKLEDYFIPHENGISLIPLMKVLEKMPYQDVIPQ